MAKNANAKVWALQIGELNRRWSDQPFDLTGPSAPTIAAFGAPTSTSVGVRVTAPAVDGRTGISNYLVEIATDVNGPFSTADTISVTEATSGFQITGLLASTSYWVRVKGIDGSVAKNVGVASNVVQQTTAAAVAPSSWYPNWPMASHKMLQGNNTLDTTQHSMMADADVITIQSFYPTASRLSSRCSNIDLIRGIRAARQGSPATAAGWPKVLIYTSVQQATTDTDTLQSALEVPRDIIASPTKGPSARDWYLHRIPPNETQVLEPNFTGALRQINMAIEDMALNSFSRSYVQQLWNDWKGFFDDPTPGNNIKNRINGFFEDNADARIPPVWTPNHGAQITDYDTNQDGVVDARADFSAGPNAGGRKWAAGLLASKAAMEAEFPGFLLMPNSARWDSDYTDGAGSPPLPLSGHPFYRKWDLQLKESINNSLGIKNPTTGYTFTPGGLSVACKRLAIQDRMLRPDADNTLNGKGYVLVHANTVDRTPTQADYRWGRFIICLAMLQDRWAPCVQRSGNIVLTWDEELIEYGDPVGARTLGTLNETTLSYSQRAANFSSGVARFYWAFFQKAFVLMRGDNPSTGAWPNGADAAVACTLPAPPSGMKFQRIGPSYTNPRTGATTRNQSPLINTGADVGATVSLFPFDGIVLRIVPV